MQNTNNEKRLPTLIYTVKEVSKILHTSPGYIYNLIRAGVLPALKLGSYKVRKEALDAFLEKFEGKDVSDPYEITDLQTDDLSIENTYD